jgi:hypothetical protein
LWKNGRTHVEKVLHFDKAAVKTYPNRKHDPAMPTLLRLFSRRNFLPVIALVVWQAAALPFAYAGNSTTEPGCCSQPREADTVWLVDTRGAGCGNPQSRIGGIQFSVRMPDGTWAASDLASFIASDDPHVPTVVWVHGNRYSPHDAQHEGWQTYKVLGRNAKSTPAMRFVIFSWPSGRLKGGALEDARIKAARTPANSYYLAWLVNQMDPRVPVSYVGFSYGARVITGGLHLLSGGMLNNRVLDSRVQIEHRPQRAVLVAAAIDNHWLMPGHAHGNAVSQLDQLTNIYNSCDKALKRYRWLYCRKSDAQALGYCGIAGVGRLGVESVKICQLDACGYVGKEHTWMNYVHNCSLMARMAKDLLPPIEVELAGR